MRSEKIHDGEPGGILSPRFLTQRAQATKLLKSNFLCIPKLKIIILVLTLN